MSDNPLPLYHRIYLLLKERLASGAYPLDHSMPGENALATEFGVSRLTVRRSLEVLESEGWICRRQGRGTYPAGPAAMSTPQQGSDIDALMAHLAMMGMQTQVRLLSLAVEPASASVAARLELPVGEPVCRARRVRSHEGAPFSLLTTYVPNDIGSRMTAEDLATRPLLAILRDLGIRVARAEQSLSATLADPAAAEALDVPVGSALLRLRRLVRDVEGRPIEALHALYRPDRYEYRMDVQARDTLGEPDWVPVVPASRDTEVFGA